MGQAPNRHRTADLKASQVELVRVQQGRLHNAQGNKGRTVLMALGLLPQPFQPAQYHPAASDAGSNTGAEYQLLARHLACLNNDDGAQLTSYSAVDDM